LSEADQDPQTAEAAELAEKTFGILGDLCVLCG
jgi:hypothetical protein